MLRWKSTLKGLANPEFGLICQTLDSGLWSYCCRPAGTLPPSWGVDGAFPVLDALYLDSSSVSGALPAQWGDAAFPQLTKLRLILPGVTGNQLVSSTN